MENSEVNALIDAFVGYREMLVPIQADMHEFLETYGALRSDVEKLDNAFSGDVQGKLSEIYKTLASQAEKSEELTRKVDQFLKSSSKYTEEVENGKAVFKVPGLIKGDWDVDAVYSGDKKYEANDTITDILVYQAVMLPWNIATGIAEKTQPRPIEQLITMMMIRSRTALVARIE